MKYDFLGEIFSFSEDVALWEAIDKHTNAPFLALRFRDKKSENANAYSGVKSCIEQLRNHRFLLSFADICENEKEFCVFYEKPESFIHLSEIKTDKGHNPLWVMRETAEILYKLHRIRLFGHFPGEKAIFVDENNFKVRLGFIGLVDAFRAHCVSPWRNREARMNQFDDIRHLAQCFEESLKNKNVESVLRCLSEDKSCCLDYPKLLREMADNADFRPQYDSEVLLLFPQQQDETDARELVKNLNLNDCYVSQWQDMKKAGRRECNFQTKDFQGEFVNGKGDEHYYVSHFRRLSVLPKGVILRTHFKYIEKSPVRERSGEYHHLVALGGEKSDALRDWKIVPKNEKKFIEQTAFEARFRYVCRIPNSAVPKLSFLLQESNNLDWQKIQSLKERQKHLDAIPMQVAKFKHGHKEDVGVFEDFIQNRLVIRVDRVEADRDKIPEAGKLLIGKDLLPVPFKFWLSVRNERLFVVSDDFDDQDMQRILQFENGTIVSIKGTHGVLGNFAEIELLPEVITRDDQGNGVPKFPGVLFENVNEEVLPFRRQMEAVDSFEKGDMVEPLLGGILATPSAHCPLHIPQVQFHVSSLEREDSVTEQGHSSHVWRFSATERRLFNEKLNDSQKKAVKGALFQKPLFLIQGPPGTGKTTVIVEIICQMLADNPRARILVCSQTNLAVDNVLKRLPDKKDTGYVSIRKIRLAASKDKVDHKVHKYWFNNRLKAWVNDVINRSKQVTPTVSVGRKGTLGRAMADALDKAGGDEQKNENAIGEIVKEWQAFLYSYKGEDCQIRGNVESGWMSMEDALLKSMNVIGATCVHIASSRYREIFRDSYDCLIMDEAGKATPAESLIPILRAKQVVLIGDHKQLPPFVTDERKVWEKVQEDAEEFEDIGQEDLRRKFGESLFEKLILAFSEQEESMQVMLNTQRRMPKQIGDLISNYFYDRKLYSPDDEQFAREKRIDLPFKCQTGLIFIDTSGRKNRHDDNCAHWRKNKCNAEVVLETLRCLDQRLKEKSDFAIIAGYRGQVDLLRKQIRNGHSKTPFKYLTFISGDYVTVVNTVDGFQGQEKDIVIYDIVRSGEGGTIGFLDEPRRLNVALSRAKKLLVIVGDADFLSNRATPSKDRKDKDKPILGEIADEIREQGFVFNSLEDALE